MTFGAWLGVHPDDLRRAHQVWWEADYDNLALDGHLANMLPPWESETLAKPLRVSVRDRDSVPFAESSTDGFVQSLLTDEWPHEDVLAALARYERA